MARPSPGGCSRATSDWLTGTDCASGKPKHKQFGSRYLLESREVWTAQTDQQQIGFSAKGRR